MCNFAPVFEPLIFAHVVFLTMKIEIRRHVQFWAYFRTIHMAKLDEAIVDISRSVDLGKVQAERRY